MGYFSKHVSCVFFFSYFLFATPSLPLRTLIVSSRSTCLYCRRLMSVCPLHSFTYYKHSFNVVITSHLDHVVDNRTILAYPLYDTGYREGPFQGIAFQTVSHAETLRARTAHFYNLTLAGCPSHHTDTAKTRPIIRILDRKPESNRSLLNVEALQTALEEMTQSTVDVVYFENKTFLEQVSFMMETDILISPHGAQLTSINFMPACGAVVEAFPRGFWFPHFFGPLAASSGLTHGYIYTGKNHEKEWQQALRHRKKRFEVRKQNICLPLEKTLPFIEQFVDKWRQCCYDRLLAELG